MMKERESQDRLKAADNLASSVYSQPAKSAVGGEKDRMTLTKIKEQHQQNLKLMQENFYRDLEQLEFNYQNNIDEISKKLETMERKLSQFELMKSQIDSKQLAKSRKEDSRE
jgi:cytochrome c556